MSNKIIDVVVQQAIREGRKRSDYYDFSTKKEWAELSKFRCVSPRQRHIIVALDETPVSLTATNLFDPNIRATMGAYYIMYVPVSERPSKCMNKPYLIYQDLIRMRIYVSGPLHYKCLCERIPELRWLYRNAPLSNAMFGIAKKHPGMKFQFVVDWVRYADMIQAKADAAGIDIDHKPFVAFKVSPKRYEEGGYDKYRLAPTVDGTEKYADVVEELRKEFKDEE